MHIGKFIKGITGQWKSKGEESDIESHQGKPLELKSTRYKHDN